MSRGFGGSATLLPGRLCRPRSCAKRFGGFRVYFGRRTDEPQPKGPSNVEQFNGAHVDFTGDVADPNHLANLQNSHTTTYLVCRRPPTGRWAFVHQRHQRRTASRSGAMTQPCPCVPGCVTSPRLMRAVSRCRCEFRALERLAPCHCLSVARPAHDDAKPPSLMQTSLAASGGAEFASRSGVSLHHSSARRAAHAA